MIYFIVIIFLNIKHKWTFFYHPHCALDYFSYMVYMTSLGINSPSFVREQSSFYSLLTVWWQITLRRQQDATCCLFSQDHYMAAISVSMCGRSAQMCEMRKGKPYYWLINQVCGVEAVVLSFTIAGVSPLHCMLLLLQQGQQVSNSWQLIRRRY